MKNKTLGISPKVPVQAVAGILTAIAARYGFDLDADLALAIGTVVGGLFGVWAPPGDVVSVAPEDPNENTNDVLAGREIKK